MLHSVSSVSLTPAIARTPLDHYVIWNGTPARFLPNSLAQRSLEKVTEVWLPVSLRVVLQRTAAGAQLTPQSADRVRNAVRAHQGAQPAAYFLVRRNASGEYLAVTEIPWPAHASQPIRAGEVVFHEGPTSMHGWGQQRLRSSPGRG